MRKKGQAAMEFLMTYGWAIIVVLAAIAALAYFGVLSPQKLLPERTTFAAPLPNVDNAVIDPSGAIEIAFRNNVGVDISIDSSAAQSVTADADYCVASTNIWVTYDGAEYDTNASVVIPNGETFLVKWNCTVTGTSGSKFKAEALSFQYVNEESGQTRKQSGSVDGKYQ
ncbi:MAG: hypothetical protein ACP5N3_01860 [Candidatus Nanoarchaeia archaeon]